MTWLIASIRYVVQMSFSVRYFCWFRFIIRRRTNTHTLVHRRINPRSWTAKNIMAVHTDYDLIFKFKLIMPIVYFKNMILIAIAHIIIKLLFQSEYTCKNSFLAKIFILLVATMIIPFSIPYTLWDTLHLSPIYDCKILVSSSVIWFSFKPVLEAPGRAISPSS